MAYVTESILPAEGEHLTTGWEPDLAAEDTLIRQAVLVNASMAVEVARGAGRPWRRTDGWAASWMADRAAMANWVVLCQPPHDATVLLGEISAFFPSHVPCVLITPWPVGDLRPLGLALVGHPPLMVRFPKGARSPESRPGMNLREVRTTEELAVVERVLVQGFPMPEMQPLATNELLGPTLLEGPTRAWLAEVDGEPAAASVAHAYAGVTLVEYVATLPQARGRGAGAAVTWAATLADPQRPAVLVASDDGRPVYERMGYVAIERWTVWLRPGA